MRTVLARLAAPLLLATALVVPATALVGPAAATASSHVAAKSVSPAPGNYQPLNPTRIFDTRTSSPIASGAIVRMQIQGVAGLPASGISAVTVTLSVLTPARPGSISVFPSGTTWPGAATVSFAAASTQQNTVTAQLGSDGAISVRNNAASAVQLVADVVGYYTVGSAVPGSYRPIPLQRLYDTRAAGSQPLASGATASVPVTGRGAIPASNVSAGAVNLTVLSPTATGSATVLPTSTTEDGSATVSFTAGHTEQSMLTAQLGSDGAFSVRNNTGVALQLIIDIVGYYVAGSPPAAGGYVPLTRDRIFDSRTFDDSDFTSGELRAVPTLGTNTDPDYSGPETPHWGVRAETLLLTVVSPSRSGSISVFAGDRGFDGKATVSFPAGQTVQRLVTVRVPPEGTIGIRNNSSVQLSVVADLYGYFAGEQNRLHLSGSAVIINPFDTVSDVSCTSASFCIAVTINEEFARYDGSSWTTGFDPDAQNAVSCVSPTFCVGAGAGSVSTYGGSQWSQPVDIADRELTAISCASASFCVAMGEPNGWAYVFNGTDWDAGTNLNPRAEFSAVSCPTSTFCMAWADGWYRWNGSSWSGTASGTSPSPASVSCLSSTFCQYVTAGYSGIWNGAGWLSARAPVNHTLTGVSCPAALACIAGDEKEISGWDGTEWSMPITSTTASGLDQLRVSCPTVDFCMAVHGTTGYRLDG